MTVNIADVNGDRIVSKPDQTEVKAQQNQPVTSANFRDDITADGRIKNGDLTAIKQNKGHVLP